MKAEEYLKVKGKMRWNLAKYVESYEKDNPVKAVHIIEDYVKANPDMTNAKKFELVFGFPHDFPVDEEWWRDLYVPRDLIS